VTFDEATELVGRLFLVFGSGGRSDESASVLFDIYRGHLEGFDYGPALLAVSQLEAESTFLPKIAELRRAITAAADPQPPAPDADAAWGEVLDQIREVGWQQAPSLSPLTAETVANVGGWLRVCETDAGIMRKHFADAFKLAAARDAQRRRQAALPADVREALQRRPIVVVRGELAAPVDQGPVGLPAPLDDAADRFEAALAELGGRIGRSVDEPQDTAEMEGRREAAKAALARWEQENEPVGERAVQ
jgi:hypothetical protein